MRRARIGSWALLPVLGLLAACEGDPAAPLVDSSLSFSYSGSELPSKNIEIRGDIHIAPLLETYAAAALSTDEGSIRIVGLLQGSAAALADAIVSIEVDGTSTGTYTCDPDQATCDSHVEVRFDVPISLQGFGEGVTCELDTSTVTVESLEDNRVEGAFSGEGTCADPAGDEISTVVVTNGSFDVELTGIPAILAG